MNSLNDTGFLELRNKSDLDELIKSEVEESIHLDYKECGALGKSPGKKKEISKDVSAFANSDGGQIVYGMVEDGRLPEKIDSGFDPTDISKEWLEQVINSNINPRMAGLEIASISLGTKKSERVAYVVSVPKSYSGPHQANDKRYYKRFNFESQMMEDYEIKDVANRKLQFGPTILVDIIAVGHVLFLVIKNLSEIPAENIQISSTPPLPTWGQKDLGELHIFKNGIRYLTKEKSYFVGLGSANHLVGQVDKPFEIDVAYDYLGHYSASAQYQIDIREYFGTQPEPSVEKDYFEKIVKELKEATRESKSIAQSLKEMRKAFTESGFKISYQTLHSVQSLMESGEIRIDLDRLIPQDFILMFDLPPTTAWKLYEFLLSCRKKPEKQDLLTVGLSEEQADRMLKISYYPHPEKTT